MAELRRSCNFCRQRRMKCNGELPWCVACFERNSPCVYESVGARGRPKRKDSDQMLSSPHQVNSNSNRPGTAQSGSTTSKHSSFSMTKAEVNASLGLSTTIAQDLAALDRIIWTSIQSDNNSRHCLILDSVKPDTSLLTVLEQLVHLTTGSVVEGHYLDLGNQIEEVGIGAIDGYSAQETGQPALSSPHLMQLIELAFSHHPFLCLIVSKTSLLYDHRDGVAHASLLLIVAAEGLDLGMPAAEPLFEAGSLPSVEMLLERGESELKRGTCSFTSSIQAMSNCQTLLLLAYRMLVTSRIRRAAVYLSLCCRTLEGIRERRARDTNPVEVKMNGVQMAKVEEELLDNLYWLIGSFSLWICLQLPAISSNLSLNHRLNSSQLPAMDVNQSSLYQLDLMSGNLSVLKSHDNGNRTLFALASTYSLIEKYLYDPIPPSPLAFESQCSHPNKQVEVLVFASSRYLGLKSCLAPGPSLKTLITRSHIHILLTFANKTLESSKAMTTRTQNRPASTPMQATTVDLHVATMSTLAIVFEFLFAYSLPPPFQAQDDIMDKFDLADVDAELIEANKWQMMTVLHSFDAILEEECMSCPQRSATKRQISRLIVASNSGGSGNNSNNLFSSNPSASTANKAESLFSPTQRVPYSATFPRYWSDHQMSQYGQSGGVGADSQPPMSPYYYSLTFSDVDVSALAQPGMPAYSSRDSTKASASTMYRDVNARNPAQSRFQANEDVFDRPWTSSSPAKSSFPVPQTPSPPKRQQGGSSSDAAAALTKDQMMMPPPSDSLFNDTSSASSHVMLYTPAEFRSMNLDPDIGPAYSFSPTRPSAAGEGQSQYPMAW